MANGSNGKALPEDGGRKRHILFVHHGTVPGGAPTSLRNLVREMRKQSPSFRLTVACVYARMMPFFEGMEGVEVVEYVDSAILTGKKMIGYSPLLHVKSMPATVMQLLRLPWSIRKEAEWLSAHQPDIVHLNSSVLWSTAVAAKRVGIPVVWHVRETLKKGRLQRWFGQFLRGKADVVVAISGSEAERLGEDGAGSVRVVYNSLDRENFAADLSDSMSERRTFGLPADKYLAVSLGGFSFRKGGWQLIRTLGEADESIHLVMAGDDSALNSAPATASDRLLWRMEDHAVRAGVRDYHLYKYSQRAVDAMRGLENRVHPVGNTNRVAALISACDVLVFGGTTPHFARPVYEAWTLGKPIIAFDSPVMRMEVTDGVDGILVPRDDPAAMRDALSFLKDNPDVAAEYGRRGQKKALERFDSVKNCRAILDIYDSIAGKG